MNTALPATEFGRRYKAQPLVQCVRNLGLELLLVRVSYSIPFCLLSPILCEKTRHNCQLIELAGYGTDLSQLASITISLR